LKDSQYPKEGIDKEESSERRQNLVTFLRERGGGKINLQHWFLLKMVLSLSQDQVVI